MFILALQLLKLCKTRLLLGCTKYTLITSIIENLHWLPMRQRIAFTVILITYKTLLGQAPGYITELLRYKTSNHGRNLRSSTDPLLLQIPSFKRKVALGDGAFVSPKLRNSLPLEVRKAPSVNNFKSKLKTHLFN